MKPRILVVGGNGQLGAALAARLPATGWPFLVTTRAGLDLADAGAIDAAVARARPDVVVNAAAYTAVDLAESQAELAHSINGRAPGLLAAAAARAGAAILHFSTDYVFDGSRGPWREDDAPAPLGVYGASKLAGERAVAASNPRHIILRTSWVCGATGHNFLRTMLRLAQTRDELRVVADQFGAPTFADDLAEAVVALVPALVRGHGPGVFHLTGAPWTSWHGFAQAILAARAGLRVVPIPTADYPTPARRPADGRLDCARIEAVHGVVPADWRLGLGRVLAQLQA